MFYINTLAQVHSTAKTYEHNLLDEKYAMIGTDAIWLLRVVCLLMWIIGSFLRFTGYLNFIKDHISHVLLLILVHVLLLSCLTPCLAAIKNMFLNIVKQVMRGMVKVYFRRFKIQVRFLIN